MDKLPITALIAAKNEEKNILACLRALWPCERVILLDSQSNDATTDIATQQGAEIIQFNYLGGYPKKRQWALDNVKIETNWILLIDADEVVPNALWLEIKEAISLNQNYDAYMIKKGFHFLGREMNFGGFSHNAVMLIKSGKAKFEQLFDDEMGGLDMEVHERVIVNGRIGALNYPLIHKDQKGLESYLNRHNHYSTWEARLRSNIVNKKNYGQVTIKPNFFGNSQERRRALKKIIMKLYFEPTIWFIYHYFFKLGFVEGRAGYIASKIRANYIFQVKAKLYEISLNNDKLEL